MNDINRFSRWRDKGVILMNDISIEDKIKVLEQLYVKEKDEEKKLLILYQIKKYRELLDVKSEL